MRISKPLCLLQIGVQFFYSSLCVYSFSFEAIADTKPPHNVTENPIAHSSAPAKEGDSAVKSADTGGDLAGMAVQAGGMLQNGALKDQLVSGATGKAAQGVEEWLNQFGTARVKVSADNNFSLEEAELDVLLPLYDDKKANLIFTQLGSRRVDDRNIINTGVGYRHFSPKWMWGANTFYDRQISENHHQRFGVGGELGWDYLKISANGYMRLSDWMASSRYEDYDERAANGFDIRTEGYLPAWPQLGASIMYEQYFGENVDLFNDDTNRQKDPYAVTVGVNYTPFTLVTAGISQKMGKGDTQDTQFNLSFSYSPSVGLDKQLDPGQVALRRSLQGSRQDLVNRNNTIVLDYRKQDLISLGLPEKMEGAEGVTLPVSATINSKYGVDRIDWQADSLTQHGGKITRDARSGQYSMTLPDYQYGGASNHYVVTGKAYDAKGNDSNNSQMNVYVNGFDASTWQTTTTAGRATLPADGISTSTIAVNLVASDQQPVTGMAGQLTATVKLTPAGMQKGVLSAAPVQNATVSGFTEASPGVYTGTFTSGNVAGAADIVPVINGTTTLSGTRIMLQGLNVAPALSTLTASKTNALANGTDTVQLTAKVTTPDGAPYQGVTVFWDADNAAAQLSGAQSISDENGVATITVSSLSVINTAVSARIEQGGTLKSEALSFGADTSSAQVISLSADKLQALASNTDNVTLVATVRNAQNQPLTGAKVDWTVGQGTATLNALQSTTDEQGNAQITLASSVAGDVVVSARAGTTEAKNSDAISFVADSASMNITTLTLDKTQALANGSDAVTYTATVTDANGNKVQGAPVNWSSDKATAQLSASLVSTDAQGQATIRVITTTASDVVISAQLPGGTAKAADAVTFIADASTAKLSAVTADKTQALANGTDVITLSTAVTDASGNPLSNADVSWSATPTAGTPSSDSTKTDAQGLTTIRLTSSSVTDYSVTASVNGTQATSPTLTFSADAFTAHLTSLVADKTAAVVAGKDRVNLSATVLDANNHPVQGVTVSWSSDNSSGTFTPVSGVTGVDGIAVAQFIGTKAQTTVITATMGSGSKTQSLEMIADNSTARFGTVTASKTQALANGTDVVTWTATVEDANQNPINNMAVNWNSDNVSVTPANGSTSTNASGVATVTATSTQTADAVMTAALTTPALSSSASKVSFIADASTAQLSTVTTDKTQALANGTEAATLATTVTDAQGNPLADVDVNWSVSPVTGTLSSTSTKTTAQGVATVTLSSLTVGNDTVTASVNGKTASSPAIAFIADAATAKIATLTADKTTAVVAGVDTVALQATVLDANNHPVANIPVTWSSDNAAGILAAVSGVTDINGVASATLSSTLAQNTVVTASAGSSQKTLPVEIIADAASAQVTMAADKTQAVANGTEAVTWTATVKDANSNPVKAVSVDWSGDNASVTLAGSTSQTTAAGTATVTGTSLKTGSEIVTATLTQQQRAASAAAVSYIADVSTADIASLTVDRPTASANGSDKAAFTATVKDAQGNLVTNAAVNWATTLNTLADITSQTNASGVATMTLSGTASGDATVTASVGGKSKSAMTKFVSQINSDWNITGASGKFSTNFITGYGYMGFVAVAPTGGPTSLVYVEDGVTPLTTPMTDEQGQQVTVNFGGQRTTYCSTHTFNTDAGCAGGGDVRADLLYSASDNPGLPAGVYHGTIHFAGQDKYASGANSFNYEVSVSLTVP